jgi:hypothetical protein
VSSNPSHCVLYSMQHYVINFVSDLRQVCGFLRFPPPIKLIATEIMLKVALNTININLLSNCKSNTPLISVIMNHGQGVSIKLLYKIPHPAKKSNNKLLAYWKKWHLANIVKLNKNPPSNYLIYISFSSIYTSISEIIWRESLYDYIIIYQLCAIFFQCVDQSMTLRFITTLPNMIFILTRTNTIQSWEFFIIAVPRSAF